MAKPAAPAKPPVGNEDAKGATSASGAWSKALGASTKLAGGIKALGAGAKSLATGSLPSASSAMSTVGKMAGGIATDGANALGDALAKLGPEGEAAGAAVKVLGAAVSATIGTLADLAGIAIEVTQKMDLMRDRFAALAGSAAGGKAVQASIANLAKTLPFASSQVSEWAQRLLAAGLQGKQLEESIKAIAAAQALMGDAGGAAAEKMLKQLAEGGAAADKMVKALQQGGPKSARLLAEMGLHTSDLAAALGVSEAEFGKMKLSADQLNNAITKALQKKGKGPLEDMALTFPSILQKAREGFLSLFSGLGGPVKEFMKAVKALFSEFNKGGGVAKGLKPIVTSVLTTVFKYAAMAVKAVHSLIQGFMGSKKATGPFASIGAALRKVWDAAVGVFKAFSKMFGGGAKGSSGLSSSLKILAMVVELVAGFVSGLLDSITQGIALFGAISDMVSGAGSALSGLADDAMNAGKAIIDGLLSFDPGAFVSKMINMAKAGLNAFKSVLGIASPSKVMARMTGYVGDGAVQGLDRSAGRVEDSAASLGAGVKSGAAKGMGGADGKGGGSSKSITIEAGAIVIHAGGATITEEALASILERLLASQGA